MSGLTPKQKQLFDFIGEFQTKHGYSPSQREIANHFGFKSLGTVQNYLTRMDKLGLLDRTPNAKRGLTLSSPLPPPSAISSGSPSSWGPEGLQDGDEILAINDSNRPQISSSLSHSISLPILGRVAAGRPFESSISGETLDVPRWFLDRGGDHFLLRVVGDSMIGEGIFEDDYVVIKKQPTARNGQTVVASIDNEATIKKYYRKGNVVELHSANPKYPIFKFYLDRVSFRIEGVLNGVLRRFSAR